MDAAASYCLLDMPLHQARLSIKTIPRPFSLFFNYWPWKDMVLIVKV